MQEWDRLAMLLVSGGIAIYTGYTGWRLWRRRRKGPAVGIVFLALATAALPILWLAVGR